VAFTCETKNAKPVFTLNIVDVEITNARELMIISASRRTDIPAFYVKWFMNRIRAGYCTVPNPFNPKQIARVSLKPEDVDVIVFWTRNPSPLIPNLDELDSTGYRYYFQYTLLGNPRPIETNTPSLDAAIRAFRQLSDRIGAAKVVWRYDPIVFSSITDVEFHIHTYTRIATALHGYTKRSVISILDFYRKMNTRLVSLKKHGIEIKDYADKSDEQFAMLMKTIAKTARQNDMEIVSCAEQVDLMRFGIHPGKCVDNNLIQRLFGINVSSKQDSSQRSPCGCVVSKDIGMYNSCLFGCQYCYANSNFEKSRKNYELHNPESPSLLGWHEVE
jgi:hypothetical protein